MDGHAPPEPAQEDGRGAARERRLSFVSTWLLADSRSLFSAPQDPPSALLEHLRWRAESGARAVYLGASNGDDPAAIAVFEAAMASLRFERCRTLSRRPSATQREELAAAEVVVLAGGDPEVGWRAFEQAGLLPVLTERHRRGATLIGVSAGAMQMGLGFATAQALRETFGWVPCWVDVHDEADDWRRLRRRVASDGRGRPGLAIPFGAVAGVTAEGRVVAFGSRLGWLQGRDGITWRPPNRDRDETWKPPTVAHST